MGSHKGRPDTHCYILSLFTSFILSSFRPIPSTFTFQNATADGELHAFFNPELL